MAFVEYQKNTNRKSPGLKINPSGSISVPKYIAERYGYNENSTYWLYIDEENCYMGIQFRNDSTGKQLHGVNTLNIPIITIFKNLGLFLPKKFTSVTHDLRENLMAINLSKFKVKIKN